MPIVPKGALAQATGIIGSIIMPHNLYLHSRLVLSRKINMKSYRKVATANRYFAIESGVSLFLSYLGNLAIISTFSHYRGYQKTLDLYTAGDML